MAQIFELISFVKSLGAELPNVITYIIAALTTAITVSMAIPGEQPEKTLQKIVDFLKKWSRK